MAAEDLDAKVQDMFGDTFLRIISSIAAAFERIFSQERINQILAKVIDVRIDRMIGKL